MDLKKFEKIVEASRLRQDTLLELKGREYTRMDPDRLANFKRWGRELDIPPIKVWAVFAGKHIDSIITFVKTGDTGTEGIKGRLDDLHNYLSLGEALIEEDQAPKQPFPSMKAKHKKPGRK